MNKLGKVAVAVAMAFSVGAAEAEEPAYFVEYVASTGAQYVDTGVPLNPNSRVVLDFAFTAATKSTYLFGEESADGFVVDAYINSSTKLAFSYQNAKGNRINTQVAPDTKRHILDFNGPEKYWRILEEDGSLIKEMSLSSYSATGTATRNAYVFAGNNSGSPYAYGKFKLYSMKIYETADGVESLVRDFKPCVDSVGKPALYDAENRELHYNLGTGADFAAGGRLDPQGDVMLEPTGVDDTENISEALKSRGIGDTVFLKPGTYNLSATVGVPAGVSVKSKDGDPDSVTVRLSSAVAKAQRLTLFKLADTRAMLAGLTFTGGSCGAVAVTAGTVSNCVFKALSGNSATWIPGGGGVCIEGEGKVIGCRFLNCTFTNTGNYARPGGMIYASGSGIEISDCIFTNNTYGTTTATQPNKKYGIAVYLTGSGTLRNLLVADNNTIVSGATGADTNTIGSVAIAGSGTVLVENCTIAGNYSTSPDKTSGLFCDANAKVTVRNCLLYGNTNKSGVNDMSIGAQTVLTTSWTTAGGGVGFFDPDAGDYRVISGPTIDAGTNDAWMETAKDLDGKKRISGPKVDIGCYEFQQENLALTVVADRVAGLEPLTVSFSAEVRGPDLMGLKYSWSFVDGGKTYEIVDDPDAASIERTYTVGRYHVKAKVSNSAGATVEYDLPDEIFVTGGRFFVDPDCASPEFPYADWRTAATNLADVLTNEFCGVGSAVIVKNGSVNRIAEALTVSEGVGIFAESGASETFIQPLVAGNFCMLTLSHPDAVLNGFTVRNSTYQAVGLVGGGTVSNCVFRGNSGVNNTPVETGGSAIYVSGKDNVITHCTFSNNTISVAGGSVRHGAAVCVLDNAFCVIDNCLFAGNALGAGTAVKYGSAVRFGSGSKGRVRNCLFVKNSATGTDTRGALALVGSGTVDVENCTFVGNTTSGGNSAGLYANGNAHIVNCLFADNMNAAGVSNLYLSASATVSTCRETDDLKDFKRPSRGNYHLKGCSPALNAGTDAEWMKTATDLEGNPRIRQRAVDIGCYEDLETGFSILVR